MGLRDDFDAAVDDLKALTIRPSHADLLRIYGLYKQATEGDNASTRPGLTDVVGRAKHDAWAKHTGMSTDDAMRAYVALVDELT